MDKPVSRTNYPPQHRDVLIQFCGSRAVSYGLYSNWFTNEENSRIKKKQFANTFQHPLKTGVTVAWFCCLCCFGP